MPRKPAVEKTPQEIEKAKADKRAKFLEIAPGRVSRAISTVMLLGNLSGSAYDYEPEYAAQIVAALRRTVDNVEAQLNRTAKKAPAFQFNTTPPADGESPAPTA